MMSAKGGITLLGSKVASPVGVMVIRVITGTRSARTGCCAAAQSSLSASSASGAPIASSDALTESETWGSNSNENSRSITFETESSVFCERSGTEAWAETPLTRTRSELTTFSPTETVITWRPLARSSSCPPPSFRAKSHLMSGRSRTSQDMPTSAVFRSSSDSATRTTSPRGRTPLRAKAAIATARAASSFFMSTAPRPTRWPSRSVASKGGTVQLARGAGTTSVWAISISDGPSPVPGRRAIRFNRSGSGPTSSHSMPASRR